MRPTASLLALAAIVLVSTFIALVTMFAPVKALVTPTSHSIAGSRQRIASQLTRSGMVRPFIVGSSQPVTAEPPVPRPHEKPCVVTLFSDIHFVDFSQHLWPYAPPAACPPPWQEVVLDANFNVTAGVQFDRTANIWVAGTNVYFGTTVEPSPSLSPSWHVERDVTELSPIFKSPSTGQVVLGNIVNSTYTGIISGSAKLEFYPMETAGSSTRPVPDRVYPLSAGPLGGAVFLYSPTDQNAATFTLPRNIEQAYLEVYLQSQIGDEFWYTCFPDVLAQELNNCGHTAFREGEVSIDGQPAGVAPVYPWIYTGGIDPYLWVPIPGVEALDFRPYRINLTPFAGLLSNGQPHTLALSVYNDDNYFATTASLLLFLDHHAAHTSGGIISNSTTALPTEVIDQNVTTSNGVAKGLVGVTATHPVSIDGFVNTSHGRVETQVVQNINFTNNQNILVSATQFKQDITQLTSIASKVTTHSSGASSVVRETKSWPLLLDYNFVVYANGSASQVASVHQAKIENGQDTIGWHLSNVVNAYDTLLFPATGGLQPVNPKTSQQFVFSTSNGFCYNHTVTAFKNIQTGSFFGGCGH